MKPNGSDGPHVFVDDLECIQLYAQDHAHLTRSLRLRPGDAFTACDGRGSWRVCRLGRSADTACEPDGEVVFVVPVLPKLTVGYALIKGGRPELITQKVTELGVDAIVPFVAERSVVRWDIERSARHIERLRRVARESAMQSRQVRLPEIGEVADFRCLVSQEGTALAHITGVPISLQHPTILVGPEGGWSAEECTQAPTVCLGDSVLRSETAAITAAALLTALRHGVSSSR